MTTLSDSNSSWKGSPHAVIIGETFADYEETLKYVTEVDRQDPSNKEAIDNLISKLSQDAVLRRHTSAAIGGNDAINPLAAFHEDDDIALPCDFENVNSQSVEDIHGGMGLEYADMYDDNQRIMWMQFGVPVFNNLRSFYKDAVDKGMLDTLDGGTSALSKLGSMVMGAGTKAVALAFAIPFAPLGWAYGSIKSLNDTVISQFYSFRPEQILYYASVNTILAHLAVNMELFDTPEPEEEEPPEKNLTKNVGDPSRTAPPKEVKPPTVTPREGLPLVLRNGPDIVAIINSRANRFNTTNDIAKIHNMENYIKDIDSMENMTANSHTYLHQQNFKTVDGSTVNNRRSAGILSTFGEASVNAGLGGANFIGIRINKSVDASESFSNSTGPTSIANKLNSMAEEATDKAFSVATGADGANITGIDSIDKLISGGIDVIKDGAEFIGLSSMVGVKMSGTHITIPDIWKSSSVSTSHSFSMSLDSKYGSKAAIYQNICIPTACMLAAALPRSTGDNSYSSPFLVRAYCKGMFAIENGIIDSLSIKRGDSEYGWTVDGLPTKVEISFSIKDLSPEIAMSIADKTILGGLGNILKRDTPLQDYLSTFAGMGLNDRLSAFERFTARRKAFMQLHRTTTANPIYWGARLGASELGQQIFKVTSAASEWHDAGRSGR